MNLTKEQKGAAINLSVALTEASETGLFDMVAADVDPVVINKFCDDVNDFICRHTVPQWILADYDHTGLKQIQRNDEGALETDDEAILAVVREAEVGCRTARAALHQHLIDAEKIWARKGRSSL